MSYHRSDYLTANDPTLQTPLTEDERAELYSELASGAESGWDYSSRWLADPQRLASIRTTDIVPVDLNSLMLIMEETIAKRSDVGWPARRESRSR